MQHGAEQAKEVVRNQRSLMREILFFLIHLLILTANPESISFIAVLQMKYFRVGFLNPLL